MEGLGPGLEDGVGLERPGRRRVRPPGFQRPEQRGHRVEIVAVVGAEIQPGALPRPAGDGFKKFRLQHPVLMVALLGPGIGEEHPDFRERDAGREGGQKLPGLRADEMAVGQPGTVRFALCAGDALAADIHPDAVPAGKFGGVARQEVAVAAANLPGDGGGPGQQGGESGTHGGAPGGDLLDKFGFESHAPNWRGPPAGAIPKRTQDFLAAGPPVPPPSGKRVSFSAGGAAAEKS